MAHKYSDNNADRKVKDNFMSASERVCTIKCAYEQLPLETSDGDK